MKLLDLKRVHQGKFLSYYVASYLNKDNKIKEYEFISRDPNLTKESFGSNVPAGVGLVPFNKDKTKIVLQSEFRLATNHFIYNFPAGLIDEGETAEIAAARELKEETGLDLVSIEAVLPPSYASPGTSDEEMKIVICTVEGEIQESCFADEEIQARWFTKEEVKKLLEEGAYMSVRTQMLLYMWTKE